MSKTPDKKVYRVIDANLNRAKEGLRVCEDTARFILDKEILAKKIKKLRHDITRIATDPNLGFVKLLKFRNSDNDLGKEPDFLEKKRKDTRHIFIANFQRTKEAVRVLEEFTKLIDEKISGRFKKARFRLYSLEKYCYDALSTK